MESDRRTVIALECCVHSAPVRWELRVFKKWFRRIEFTNSHKRVRFCKKGTGICWVLCKDAVKCGQSFGETTHGTVGDRQVVSGGHVARVEFDTTL